MTDAGATTKAYGTGPGVYCGLSATTSLNLFEVHWLDGPVPVGSLPDGSPYYASNSLEISAGFTF